MQHTGKYILIAGLILVVIGGMYAGIFTVTEAAAVGAGLALSWLGSALGQPAFARDEADLDLAGAQLPAAALQLRAGRERAEARVVRQHVLHAVQEASAPGVSVLHKCRFMGLRAIENGKPLLRATNDGVTVKRCLPFLDAMTTGWIIPLASTRGARLRSHPRPRPSRPRRARHGGR